ncbi:MAG: DUF4956 domain-containing protein [Gemmataceae bacterium]|nr:DUF4956 domain-containing protein [Gemmataceae bacterium]MCI0739214.1 DUF4956 domain-containing protein [Gemmataceae bacterium]
MFDWLVGDESSQTAVALGNVAARLLIAFVLGCVVGGVYALTQRKPRTEVAPFVTTLVLLCILIAMVTLVIGNSVARAFSLVGALAIVRFRTVVEDTRDTAYVIFAVVVGMGVGASDDLVPIVPLLGIPIVAVAAWLLSLWSGPNATATPAADYALAVRLGLGREPNGVLQSVFEKHLALARLKATTTARQGAALDLSYVVRLRQKDDAVAFVTALNQVEGVQNVELREM